MNFLNKFIKKFFFLILLLGYNINLFILPNNINKIIVVTNDKYYNQCLKYLSLLNKPEIIKSEILIIADLSEINISKYNSIKIFATSIFDNIIKLYKNNIKFITYHNKIDYKNNFSINWNKPLYKTNIFFYINNSWINTTDIFFAS